MELQEIEVIIEKNGETQFHVKGVKGKKCLSLTEALEKSLGTVIERKNTHEMNDYDDNNQYQGHSI